MTTKAPTKLANTLELKELPEGAEEMREVIAAHAREIIRAEMSVLQSFLKDVARLLQYHVEYALWSEGRDRFSGPRPHDKLRELRRQCDDLRKALANGFTTNDRPDPDGAG